MPLAPKCISRTGLRSLVVQAIQSAGTLADDRVYEPNTLPQMVSDLPTMVVEALSERKDTSGTGSPQFLTVIVVSVEMRVAGTDQAVVERDLDQLVSQAEAAILCNAAMVAQVQRFTYVETHAVIDNTTDMKVGEGTMFFGCQVPQLYLPDSGVPYAGATITTVRPPSFGPTFNSP